MLNNNIILTEHKNLQRLRRWIAISDAILVIPTVRDYWVHPLCERFLGYDDGPRPVKSKGDAPKSWKNLHGEACTQSQLQLTRGSCSWHPVIIWKAGEGGGGEGNLISRHGRAGSGAESPIRVEGRKLSSRKSNPENIESPASTR